MKKRPQSIPINPREPLTRKARAAILAYCQIKAEKAMPIMIWLITWTLEAERMKRKDLYAWLEAKGHTWQPASGCWYKKSKTAQAKQKVTS